MDYYRTMMRFSIENMFFISTLWFSIAWHNPVMAQLPLMPSGGSTGQTGRNSGPSADLLHLQSRSSAAAISSIESRRILEDFDDSSVSICASASDCSEERQRPVCGSDGRTYESRCEITRAKCEGHPVEFKHKGKCLEIARCRAQRASAEAQSRRYTTLGIFVPECLEDGSYSQVQCHSDTGYCWCVDDTGKPISGSSVRHKKPNCAQEGSRRINRRRTTSAKGPRQLKACGNSDRSTFNRHLIELFRSEYNRQQLISTTALPVSDIDPLLDTEQKRVVQWKFTQLDENLDNALKRKELRDLRRMVKKIVRPRPCAKSFSKYCDLDHNKKVSRTEWSTCLGVDINISFRLFMSLNSDEQTEDGYVASEDSGLSTSLHQHQHHLATHFETDEQEPTDEDEEDEESDAVDGYPSTSSIQGSSLGTTLLRASAKHLTETLNGDERASDAGFESREEDLSDCLTARRSATEQHHQAPTGNHYIPDCTPEGGYQAAQCHQLTRYCWCVHQKSGKPIRGTATRGVKPDCEAARKSARAFKGCSLKKKQRFTEEYLEFITQEMYGVLKNKTQTSVMSSSTTNAEAAKWKMGVLDHNKNLVLDRKEWKVFRKDWKIFRKANKRRAKLRKCWRNYLRFCDANGDHRITLQEWLTCTSFTVSIAPAAAPAMGAVISDGGANSGNINPSKGNTVLDKAGSLPKRRGPNPFDTILKSD